MKYNKLGSSDLNVSRVCLGTMTFGVQNTQADADTQLDYAIGEGVNFIDTAELYPIPPGKDLVGDTERIIGDYLSRNKEKRSDLIVMTKITGRGLSYIRNADVIKASYINKTIEESLSRLGTDYIDVYQLHWPNRPHPHFGRHWHDAISYADGDYRPIEEEMIAILEVLAENIKAGKIRHIGVSNETAWGIAKYAELSRLHNLPRMISTQNEFSLLKSSDWPSVTEACAYEDMGYLPWSPLASGALSGKYIDKNRPDGSRWTMLQRNGIFRDTDNVNEAVKKYKAIAEANNITTSQLSLAWVNHQKWVTSTIIGATKMDQLKDNIKAFDMELSPEVLKEISAVIKDHPMPF